MFLQFLPLLPKQILLNNFLTDFPAMAISTDRVDPELVERPRKWDIRFIRNFMSQKVQIAGALLSDPELCVLDEPTTGLDPVNVRLVQDLLVERRRNGRSTILSTHHMNQVESLCDRVALINKGQLMVYGAVDEVRRRYSLPEVRIHARDPLPAVPHAASIVRESDTVSRVMLVFVFSWATTSTDAGKNSLLPV